MNRVGATITSTLGTMAYLLAHDPDRPEMPRSGRPEANTTLRLLGAAPMPVEVDDVIRERFGVKTFSGAYGVTEASLVSWQPPGVTNKPNAAGKINDEYFDVRIFDDDDSELPRGVDGEVVVRPKRPHVMFEGYWGRPEVTVETSRNWWYHTGDIGRIDDDGYLFFVDRKADYLRRRGENISSYEVESVLMSHGDLADVAVHAVPSQLTEDDLKVTATLKDGAGLQPEELFRWCVDAPSLLCPPPLRRIPARVTPESGRSGPQTRPPRRRGDPDDLGCRSRGHHLREALIGAARKRIVSTDDRPGPRGDVHLGDVGRGHRTPRSRRPWPSIFPARRYKPADLGTVTRADWIQSVCDDIDAAGLDDVVLVGHSLAGFVIPGVAARLKGQDTGTDLRHRQRPGGRTGAGGIHARPIYEPGRSHTTTRSWTERPDARWAACARESRRSSPTWNWSTTARDWASRHPVRCSSRSPGTDFPPTCPGPTFAAFETR